MDHCPGLQDKPISFHGELDQIRRLCSDGQLKYALHILSFVAPYQLQECPEVYVSLLRSCLTLRSHTNGKQIHAYIVKFVHKPRTLVQNAVLNMYVKLGFVEEACSLFQRMPDRNIITWTTLIGGCARHGCVQISVKLFQQMQDEGVMPNMVTFLCILNACACVAALERGKEVHAQVIKTGFELDYLVATTLVDLYAKCGSINYSCAVFDRMATRDTVSWNAILKAYAWQGNGAMAIKLFHRMQEEGIVSNRVTFLEVLCICASQSLFGLGKHVHAHCIQWKLGCDTRVGNILINMYARCMSMNNAVQIFHGIGTCDVISCSTMISGWVYQGVPKEALGIFTYMQQEGIQPNNVVLLNIFNACAVMEVLEPGKFIHAYAIKLECDFDISVGNSLLDMYSNCGNIEHAHTLFSRMHTHDVVSWNTMIAAYSQHGNFEKAVHFFKEMLKEGMELVPSTFSCIFNACGYYRSLSYGRQVHTFMGDCGFPIDLDVENSLLDMYIKCGSIDDAHEVFRGMGTRDVVSWTIMIAGKVGFGHNKEALNLFSGMCDEGILPNEVTFVSLLNACTGLGSLGHGKRIHLEIFRTGYKSNVLVMSSLINMYAKCGAIEDALCTFEGEPHRDVVLCNTVMLAYIQHGNMMMALTFFTDMQSEGLKPSKVTFINLLSGCASQQCLQIGKLLHAFIIASLGKSDVNLDNALMTMYAKCNDMCESYQVFDRALERNRISWNAMLEVYAHHTNCIEYVSLLRRSQQQVDEPDTVTFINILGACATIGACQEVKYAHSHILKLGLETDILIGNTLVNTYASIGSIESACAAFNGMLVRDVVSWNVMIAGLSRHGNGVAVLNQIKNMQQDGISPDKLTCISALSACQYVGFVDEGCHYFHSISETHGLSLTDGMYASMLDLICHVGWLEEANNILCDMPFQPTADIYMGYVSACKIYGYGFCRTCY